MRSIGCINCDLHNGNELVSPEGQHVSVTAMHDRGAKGSRTRLPPIEPMIGFIHKSHDNGKCMAYRYNGYLILESECYRPRDVARLYHPEIQEWNKDRQIHVVWTLVRWENGKDTPGSTRLVGFVRWNRFPQSRTSWSGQPSFPRKYADYPT